MENLEKAIEEIRREMPGLKLLENEPLAAHSSFRIGGPVRALAVPSDVTSLSKICCLLKEHELAPFILGNGTNLLFPDEGLQDLFIISTEKLTKLFLLPDGAIYAEAGVSLSKLALFAQQNGLAGLEFASGIPGSLGGGCIMNAGAYGGELKDVIESVVCYYLPEQALYELTNENCAFGYRTSYFQTHPGCVVLSAVLRLQPGDGEEIAAKMRELNEKRRAKQPLDLPSAGSAFRRPEGHFAAALIEEAGLKGYRIGGAQVSEKHAGFVVNVGGASSHDVHDLMRYVRKVVYEHSGVVLEPEMILLGPDYKLEDHGPAVPRHRIQINDPEAVTGGDGEG
ncbi:MAG: UDP-N-acetylmuramate dehydrogenase [Oscillospiraceae bacterium]|nr:UDP-N-acetylmuramate dehydrogenase [Oscillospiraceae bacterium]